jgi:lambda family phage portal protein
MDMSNKAIKTTTPPPAVVRVATRIRRAATSVRSAFFGRSSTPTTAYESANGSIREVQAPDTGPNSAIGEIAAIRRRSRHTYRNDPLYRQSMRQVANNVIGYGIKPIIPYPDLAELWEDWIEEADSRGQFDFYGLQWMSVFNTALSGESIIRFREREESDGLSVPFQLQLMEGDHLPLDRTLVTESGNIVVGGVERDKIDRIVAYHLYQQHPSDYTVKTISLQTTRVPAKDVSHIYFPERLGDNRGIPWACAALRTYDSLRTYDIAEVERKKGTSLFGGFFRKPIGEDQSLPGTVETEDEDVALQALEPNTFVELPPGYEVDFANPPSNDANYPSFRREQLSAAAVSVGLSYEHVTLNFEKVNDRQYRAMMLEIGRMIESLQYLMVVQQLCKPVWRRFVSTAILTGKWTPPEGAKPRDYMRVEWVAPARGHIHPVQEITAIAESIKAGTFSRKRAAALLGDDVEKIDLENARDQARAEKLGLRYSVYTAKDGTPPSPSATSAAVEALAEAEVSDQIERIEIAESD